LDTGTREKDSSLALFVLILSGNSIFSFLLHSHYNKTSAGAFAQLRQNATKAKIPFYGNEFESDPVKVLHQF